jgi:hypothetical protein
MHYRIAGAIGPAKRDHLYTMLHALSEVLPASPLWSAVAIADLMNKLVPEFVFYIIPGEEESMVMAISETMGPQQFCVIKMGDFGAHADFLDGREEGVIDETA